MSAFTCFNPICDKQPNSKRQKIPLNGPDNERRLFCKKCALKTLEADKKASSQSLRKIRVTLKRMSKSIATTDTDSESYNDLVSDHISLSLQETATELSIAFLEEDIYLLTRGD